MGFFNWAAPLVRRYGDRWTPQDADFLADLLVDVVAPGGRVLDVGGGSGQLAILLSHALDAEVTVLDPSAELLDHVPEDVRVHPALGSAEAIPLESNTYDALVVTDAFHHFADLDAAVGEFTRVVRRGGAVLIFELDRTALSVRIVALLERFVGEPATFFAPGELCAFMAARGIDGECEYMTRTSYRFLGMVRQGEREPTAQA